MIMYIFLLDEYRKNVNEKGIIFVFCSQKTSMILFAKTSVFVRKRWNPYPVAINLYQSMEIYFFPSVFFYYSGYKWKEKKSMQKVCERSSPMKYVYNQIEYMVNLDKTEVKYTI